MRLFKEPRMTKEAWFDELDRPGRELTLAELTALELMHICTRLGLVAAGLGMDPSRGGGYLEQVRNIWDGLLKRTIAQQQQTSSSKRLASERDAPLQFPKTGQANLPEGGGG
jgi:hypothetical protein